MKRIGGLFDAIASRPVLSEAFRRAALGKRDLEEARIFALDLDARLERIAHQLQDEIYEFGPYRAFRVHDGKSRLIHAPPFEQRVVHHAIALVAGPIFERGAIPFSFACRKSFGHERALDLARRHVRESAWFLHVDIDGFFLDSVDHWALDSFAVRRYARYMDDIGAWGEHDQLTAFRRELIEQLHALGLSAKHGGVLNRCSQGMTFLGFTLRPDRMRLHKRGRKRLRAKLSTLHRDFRKGRIGEEELRQRGTALFAWARRGDDAGWRRAVLGQHFDYGDALELAARDAHDARRQLREHGRELPVRLSQQEAGRA